jgi:hypothetical protein
VARIQAAEATGEPVRQPQEHDPQLARAGLQPIEDRRPMLFSGHDVNAFHAKQRAQVTPHSILKTLAINPASGEPG